LPWFGHNGDVQHADRASGLFFGRFMLVPICNVISVARLSNAVEVVAGICDAPEGPFGKVRSSMSPDWDWSGKSDEYWVLFGKACDDVIALPGLLDIDGDKLDRVVAGVCDEE